MEANEQPPQNAHEHEPQNAHDHSATPRASAFLWGAVALGVLLVVLLLTHGFGLFGGRGGGAGEKPALVRQGQRIFIPESSPLRERLAVMPAQTRLTGGRIVASEPYDDDPSWESVPDRSLVVVESGAVTVTPLEPAPMEARP